MLKVGIALVLLLGLVLAGGCLYLAYGKFPVTTTSVEKVIPDARFPK